MIATPKSQHYWNVASIARPLSTCGPGYESDLLGGYSPQLSFIMDVLLSCSVVVVVVVVVG